MEAWDRRGTDRTWAIIDAVQKVAEDRGVSMAEVALAWVTDRPGVTSTILGARTVEQLETNLKAADLHLTAEETAALDEASDPGAADYPYGDDGRGPAQPGALTSSPLLLLFGNRSQATGTRMGSVS